MLRNVLSAAFACGLFAIATVGAPTTVDAQSVSASHGNGNGNGNGNGGGNNKPPKTEAPEISAHGAPAALAIVLGGAAIVLGRRRRKAA